MGARSNRTYISLSLLLLALLPFQNCGQPMRAFYSATSASQCLAKVKSEALKVSQNNFYDCESPDNYSCERRVFSPDVANNSLKRRECDDGICVDVETRHFNTSQAREFEPAESFLPGAEYNRQEFRCSHRFNYQGIAVIDSEGESMSAALARVMDSCKQIARTGR